MFFLKVFPSVKIPLLKRINSPHANLFCACRWSIMKAPSSTPDLEASGCHLTLLPWTMRGSRGAQGSARGGLRGLRGLPSPVSGVSRDSGVNPRHRLHGRAWNRDSFHFHVCVLGGDMTEPWELGNTESFLSRERRILQASAEN